MSKTSSPALFELIKSLTKSEKRYFKIYASRHTIGEINNGVKIFDFIDKQKTFDEAVLYEHFKGEAFLNQFSITKNRLYEQIINALDAFHTKNNLDAQLYKMLHSVNILYSKGLYDHATKELIKTKRLAKKHNKIAVLLKVANEEKLIFETKGYHNTNANQLKNHIDENTHLIQQEVFYNQLWHFKSQLFILLNQFGQARSEKDILMYQNIFKQYEAIQKPESFSFQNQHLVYHFESAYYFAVLEHEKSLEILRKDLLLFKNNKGKLKQYLKQYFSILTNIIHLELKEGNTQATQTYLDELKTLPQHFNTDINEDLEIKYLSSINSIELKMLNHEGNYEKAIALAPAIKEIMEKYSAEITPYKKAYLAFNLSIAYFGAEQFNQSLKWINLILNNKDLDQKVDILSFSNLLNLLIHFELKNNSLLPYAIKNTKRFLTKKERTYRFETTFLKYFTRIASAQSKYEIEELLVNIEDEITTLKNDPFECVAFEHFDFHVWLISKVKNKSFQWVKKEDALLI